MHCILSRLFLLYKLLHQQYGQAFSPRMPHTAARYPKERAADVCAVLPLLQPVAQVTSPADYSAGCTSITTKFPSGREQFTTFHPCAAFSSDCVLTAHMYFAWGMHGIIPGARDSLFSVQVRLPQLCALLHALDPTPASSASLCSWHLLHSVPVRVRVQCS